MICISCTYHIYASLQFKVCYPPTAVSPSTVERIEAFFEPALQWVGKWLPLFYVPSLVTFLSAIKGLPAVSLGKVVLLVAIGMPVTLLFTAYLAVIIRQRF